MKNENFNLAVKLRHELHKNPEVSNKEVHTMKRIKHYIEKYTDFKVIVMNNYIYVDYHINDGDYIAFRTDMDALPMDECISMPHSSTVKGVSHKCGHDGHSATMFAFLLEVNALKPDKNILFIFQHAEETGDGAKECVQLFDKYEVREIYAYHNMSNFDYKSIGIRYDIAHLGSYGMEIELVGKESHASEPEKGINPVFAFSELVANINQLTNGAMCSVVHLDVGQNAYGISAGKGCLRLTIRSDKDDVLESVRENIVSYTNNLAVEHNLKANYYYTDYFPVTYNHKDSVDNIVQAAEELKFSVVELENPYRASEDFGVYTKKRKGAIFFIGNGEDYPSIHTDNYDFRDELIKIGCDMYIKLLINS